MIKAKQVYSITKQVKDLYCQSFPVCEQIPIKFFNQLVKSKQTSLFEFYLNKEFIGFIAGIDDKKYLYLTFFAIKPKYRNLGYGGLIMDEIVKQYDHKIIGLGIEKIDDFNNDKDIKVHRYHFYLRHGFKLCNFIVSHIGGTFNILTTKPITMNQFKQLAKQKVPNFQINLQKIKN